MPKEYFEDTALFVKPHDRVNLVIFARKEVFLMVDEKTETKGKLEKDKKGQRKHKTLHQKRLSKCPRGAALRLVLIQSLFYLKITEL